MKNATRLFTLITLVIASLFLFGTAYASNGQGQGEGFVDLNGDGFNDNANAPDDDGDGIPNCIDEDYVSGDGEGSANKGENANAYSYSNANEYAEQLKNDHELKYLLFNVRKAEFKGEVPEVHGSWGDSGEANLNPEWSETSGPAQDVGHKGNK
ncbi:MAG: hypothetical protein JSV52_03750 [Candidatus Zixiibacteriota bacterium]|nr:MAG: hypothetical protein JSV52_03750 [candidate division Zixibacteria bacterium]